MSNEKWALKAPPKAEEDMTFGELLRSLRLRNDVTLGALADHLCLRVPRLCDIELDRVAPLHPVDITRACQKIGCDPALLLDKSRGHQQDNFPTRDELRAPVLNLVGAWRALNPGRPAARVDTLQALEDLRLVLREQIKDGDSRE